ncbi:hypothetical protein D3C71_78320 [compost metagenome]
MSWIKTLQVWRAQFANRKKKGETRSPTKRMLCVDELRRLTPERFIHYRPVDGLGVRLDVCYTSVDVYCQALRDFSVQIQEERAVSPTQVVEPSSSVSLDRFLISSDGYYLEPVSSIAMFKERALHLCDTMESSDYVEAGLAEHNARMLTKLFTNMLALTTCLNEVSHDVMRGA